VEHILEGIALSLTLPALAAIVIGVILGQILGAIPGLTAAMAVALLVPFSLYFDPWVGIPMMIAMFKGSLFGGALPAILLRTPGTPAASATVFDGYPLALQGKGMKAMQVALYASVFGDLFSTACLILGAGVLASVAIRFGPPEYVVLTLFALLALVSLDAGPRWKGVVAVLLGVLIACIGLDPITGTERMTFGNPELFDGIGLMPMLIGFLAVSEVLAQMGQPVRELAMNSIRFSLRPEDNRLSGAEARELLPTVLRGSAIGTLIGALPGLGATIAAFLSYNEARRASPDPASFGRGSIHGVAAAESGDSAVIGANMIPLLAFGIPGDVAAALILGALLIQGITPGPMAFREEPVAIYAIFSAMVLAGLVNYLVGRVFIPLTRHVMGVPKRLLFPAILVFASAGAFAMRGSMFDVQLMFAFAVLGWLLSRLGFPPVSLLIGFILTPILERSARQSLILAEADGGWMPFVAGRPVLVGLLTVLCVAAVLVARRSLSIKRTSA
jgi:putative tricarboxylic transport membrane protein